MSFLEDISRDNIIYDILPYVPHYRFNLEQVSKKLRSFFISLPYDDIIVAESFCRIAEDYLQCGKDPNIITKHLLRMQNVYNISIGFVHIIAARLNLPLLMNFFDIARLKLKDIDKCLIRKIVTIAIKNDSLDVFKRLIPYVNYNDYLAKFYTKAIKYKAKNIASYILLSIDSIEVLNRIFACKNYHSLDTYLNLEEFYRSKGGVINTDDELINLFTFKGKTDLILHKFKNYKGPAEHRRLYIDRCTGTVINKGEMSILDAFIEFDNSYTESVLQQCLTDTVIAAKTTTLIYSSFSNFAAASNTINWFLKKGFTVTLEHPINSNFYSIINSCLSEIENYLQCYKYFQRNREWVKLTDNICKILFIASLIYENSDFFINIISDDSITIPALDIDFIKHIIDSIEKKLNFFYGMYELIKNRIFKLEEMRPELKEFSSFKFLMYRLELERQKVHNKVISRKGGYNPSPMINVAGIFLLSEDSLMEYLEMDDFQSLEKMYRDGVVLPHFKMRQKSRLLNLSFLEKKYREFCRGKIHI